MRLIQLKIRNIASLKGEHEINFDSILKESPLFAITGDTGAGKSTLLNCVALSLYGEIYKKGVNQADVVTLGEKEGSIELLFQVQGKYYLAEWRGRVRKQNGELLKTPLTDRNIFELDGYQLNSTRLKRFDSAEKLLNLDFDQFCKCIILNQGEFARFLSSSFTERKDILEKLYPSGRLLEAIGLQLKKEIEHFEKNLSEVDIEYKAIIGSGPDISIIKTQQITIEENLKIKTEWLNFLTDADYHFTSLQNYHQKHLENSQKTTTAINEIALITSKLNELNSQTAEVEEKFKQAQDRSQKELPRLQELLKKEEALKSSKQQQNILVERQAQIEKVIESSVNSIESLNKQIYEWKIKKDNFDKTFHFDKAKLENFQDEIDGFLEFINKREIITSELSGRKNRLKELEAEGIQKSTEINELSKKLESSPVNLKIEIEDLKRQKAVLQDRRDQYQKSLAQLQECKKQIEKIQSDKLKNESILESSKSRIKEIEQELIPITTTLSLQTLVGAIEICLNHPDVQDKCPVCESALGHERLEELRLKLKKAEIGALKNKEESLIKEQLKIEQVISYTQDKLKDIRSNLLADQEKEKKLAVDTNYEIESPEHIDKKLVDLQKISWESEKIAKDLEKLNSERDKIRIQFAQTRKEIHTYEEQLQKTLVSINHFVNSFAEPTLLEKIDLFKEDAKKFKIYKNYLIQGDKLHQEMAHQMDLKEHHLKDQEKIIKEINEIEFSIKSFSTILDEQLGKQTASEIISQLHELNRSLLSDLNKKQEELKKQELQLKESNGRLTSMRELLKEIELLFEQEKTILKNLSLPLSNPLDEELKSITKSIPELGLNLQSPQELYIPLSMLIKNKKEFVQKTHHELQLSLAEIKARLHDWEKRKDRLTILELTKRDLLSALNKKQKLFEVLGRDEMRTYVLSVVEENLIIQTNEELQKLCQGRYEIVHQLKKQRLPEFYILDKFREGGLRKVSTLSGGETFMVSLAMALGLAELTRGSAEIDSLFIDEGFGTLDQNSLEDVLDMLKQIQTRGLMVGLISHVRSLTSALPLNLLLTKRTDGTSQISIQYN